MRLRDKVAVVTGAAQGIGLACAERFLGEGAKVVLSDVNADKLGASGKRLGAEFVVADASLKADVDLLIRRTIEIYGGIDIVRIRPTKRRKVSPVAFGLGSRIAYSTRCREREACAIHIHIHFHLTNPFTA